MSSNVEKRLNTPSTIIDLFTGIGGATLGLERAGWKCVWACDKLKHPCEIYRYHYGVDSIVEETIRAIDADSIPDHTILVAGFPCQSFSLAGKRKGFGDIRGTLFFDIARIAEAKRPKLLLLENVKGLLSAQRGLCFATILQTLDGLGYDIEWQVLNSKHFGVPQNRERVFIVGHLRGASSRQIFPIGETGEESDTSLGEAQGEGTRLRVANSLNCSGSGKERNLIQITNSEKQTDRVYDPSGISPTLTTPSGGRHVPQIANTISQRHDKDGKENLILLSHTKANIKQRQQRRSDTWTLDRSPQKMGIVVVGNKNPSGRGKGGQVFSEEGISPTLTSGGGNPNRDRDVGYNIGLPLSKSKIRRLTPTECERLQGFPDGWTKFGKTKDGEVVEISDTQRYKALGNAMTVNVMEYLGRRLKECLT